MHSTAPISLLLALAPVWAVLVPCDDRTSIDITVGERCSLENFEYCDATCTNKVTCTNGTFQLTETCKPKVCFWHLGSYEAWQNGVECLSETEAAEAAEALIPGVPGIALESNPGCSPTFNIGAQCGTNPKLEGAMRCDTTCSSIGICHNGVFQVNSPCSPGRCQWNPEAGQPFCV